MASSIPPNTNAPLYAFRLTTFASGRSSLGFTFAHVLADTFTQTSLIGLLSDIYVAGGGDFVPRSFPTFDNGHVDVLSGPPVPPLAELPEIYCSPVGLNALLMDGILNAMYVLQASESLKEVCVHLSRHEVQLLKQHCTIRLGTKAPAYLSSVDVLTGWYTSISSRGMDEDVRFMTYVFNLRALGLYPADFFGDGVLGPYLRLPSPEKDSDPIQHISAVALIVRQAIDRAKIDTVVRKDSLRIAGKYLNDAAQQGRITNYASEEGQIGFNSYLSYEFAHTFGFPADQCQVHTADILRRFPLVQRANRLPGQAEEDRRIELVFAVPEAKYDRVLEIIAADRLKWQRDAE